MFHLQCHGDELGQYVFLSGEDGWKGAFFAKDRSLGVREAFPTRELCHWPIVGDDDRVRQEMSGQIHCLILGKLLPQLITYRVHCPNAIQTPWLQKHILQSPRMLIPQGHAEPMDFPLGWWFFIYNGVGGLVRPHCYLRVSAPIHWPLVDIGRPRDYVLIIHYKKFYFWLREMSRGEK